MRRKIYFQKRSSFFQAIVCSFIAIIVFPAMAGEAENFLKASDRARGGMSQGVIWQVRLESWENESYSDRSFLVKSQGKDSHVTALTPPQTKGEVYLFNDRTMWFFKPRLRKPVIISARQKLSGQAANGDIATINYAADYTPQIEKEEILNGDKVKVLLLKAKSDQVTYDQIRYWVSEKSKLAIKAEFMSLQGAPFKVARFEYNNSLKSQPFISKIFLADYKFPNNRSVMTFTNPKLEKFSSSIFNINDLSR